MNWKKMMAVGLAAVSMMVFVTGCGGDAKKANTELPKKVVIGLDDSFPPMGFKDDKGEIVGFDIDMAKEAAKRAGMEVEFKAIDWSSKEAELKSKKIDALWNGLTVSPEREKNILFSNVYMKDKQYIIVRNEDESIKGKADLAGKVVGVQQASTRSTQSEGIYFTINAHTTRPIIRPVHWIPRCISKLCCTAPDEKRSIASCFVMVFLTN